MAANKAIVVMLVVSVVLMLSISCVFSEVSIEDAKRKVNEAVSSMHTRSKDVKESATHALDATKEKSSTWATWAKDKLKGIGYKVGGDDSQHEGGHQGQKPN
ncbi:hypothetical protein Scep_020619 [Stephania cephalantha]|uniref:Uncharacterized protein n=1 Tax=Stephania cephalantha TaxID=152367 RepID=A0AAP0IDG3_9MAGN